MIAELGLLALIIAFCTAVVLGIVPLYGSMQRHSICIAVARPAAWVQLVFVAIAYGCLTYAFLDNDFSVSYVAHNSNSKLPLLYKISGVWGAHEGSLLLWVLILSGWTGAVTIFSRTVPEDMIAKVLGILGLVSAGFLSFILFTSNPFARQFPPVTEGRDLNPLLQDPGLAIHPPMLYLGYVGFSVVFAFAIAALITGRLDMAWARWSRPWTTTAWSFLTLGIALGSWWAYYELGWGGWWFWDPVENASFMPWLMGTALIHTLAATEKRGVFKAWTVLLAVFAFSLSLLGTFLVRSGVLTSVHAFASDPERGLFILIFLMIVVGGSLTLYAWRAPGIRSVPGFNPVSRESALLINNVLLVTTTATVLLGTLYPLFIDALGLGKISVGPPYFNTIFIPLTVPLVIAMGFGALCRWKKDTFARLRSDLGILLLASLIAGGIWPLTMDHYSFAAASAGTLGCWAILTAVRGLWIRATPRRRWRGLVQTPRAYWGMTLAHSGIGIFVIGVAFTTIYSMEKDLSMAPGDRISVGRYEYQFDGVQNLPGPNYVAQTGTVIVSRDGRVMARLSPQRRRYLVQQMPMTEAGIQAGFWGDFYVSLGERLDDSGRWAVRVHYKAFIRWIWLGALLMAAGGLLAATDRRYRTVVRTPTPEAAPQTTPALAG